MQNRLLVLAAGAAALIAGCASDGPEPPVAYGQAQWAANGWLTPGPTSEPEVIGLYADKSECEKAVADWMSRQVVGNPVYGDCLPIDRR